eukprot:60310_1
MEEKWYIIKQLDQIHLIELIKYGTNKLLLLLMVIIIIMQYTADGIQKDNILQKYIKHIKYIVVYSGKKYDIKIGDTRAGGEKVCDAKVFDIKEEAVVVKKLECIVVKKNWTGVVIQETFQAWI